MGTSLLPMMTLLLRPCRSVTGKLFRGTNFVYNPVFRTSCVRNSFSNNSNGEIDKIGSYNSVRSEISDYRNRMLNRPDRFQPMSQREDRSAFQIPWHKALAQGKYIARYRESIVMKSAIDQMTFIQLLQEVKPLTIIELGTFTGGSTLLIDDVMSKTVDEYTIYSLDNDTSLRDEAVNRNISQNTKFLQGSTDDIDLFFTSDLLSNIKRPLLVIEDCHCNLINVLDHFHAHFKPGDYFIIEDTCPILPSKVWVGEGVDYYKEISSSYEPLHGTMKLDLIREYFTKREDLYSVDAYFSDLYGYNCTAHWNAFIRRMK